MSIDLRRRRSLLKALAAAPLAAAMPSWAAPSSRRLLVMVFLYGGNDGYNTFVPYANPLYRQLRPTIAVSRDAVLKVTEQHGFHPSLAALMPAWEARDLALVQGLGYGECTQQHYRDTEIAFTASDKDLLDEGWVSRALSRRAMAEASAPAEALAFGVLDIRGADPMGPFRGERLPTVQVHHAQELLSARRISACAIEGNGPGRARLATSKDSVASATLATRFADEPFARAMRATVDLAAAYPALPVVHVALNGLDDDKHHSVDTHWDQVKYHGDALKRLAEGLAALRSGLMEIGRWNDTLVATYDEFGRSPMENEDRGTHHGHATTHFVMGGRVKGGLHGKAPAFERMYPIGGPAPTTDLRELWSTVVERWWGGDSSAVFGQRYRALDLLKA